MDGDGKTDVAVPNYGEATVSLFKNNSTVGAITASSLATKVDFPAGLNASHDIKIADLDGDGKLDLAVVNAFVVGGATRVSVYKNTSSIGAITASSFAAKIDLSGLAIGDLDGDGKPELTVIMGGSNAVSVFRNISSSGTINAGSFAAKVDFSTGTGPGAVTIGDMNGDGKPDLVITTSPNTVSIFTNTSTSGSITASSFAGKIDFTSGQTNKITIGDIDGDGKPDLVCASSVDNTVSILRNTMSPQIADIDGNLYSTVIIGNQEWFKENLRTTKYSNGDPIPQVTDGTAWSNLTSGAFSFYNNDPGNNSSYGKLYNWYAASDSREVCPSGWHAPTDNDWTILVDYLGGNQGAGVKMKNTTGWFNDGNGNNDSGFTSLPGGLRNPDGTFEFITKYSPWWSSTGSGVDNAWFRNLNYQWPDMYRGDDESKKDGMAIRCLKNQIPLNGLVAWYPFNGNANDESGNGNNGTVSGATLSGDRFDNPNASYTYNGTSDYIDYGDIHVLDGLHNFSVSGWFKLTSSVQDWHIIAADGGYGDSNGWGFMVTPTELLIRSQNSTPVLPSEWAALVYYTFEINTWYNVTATLANDEIRLYVNGNYIGGNVVNNSSLINLNTSSTFKTGVGDTQNGAYPVYMNGLIDDVSLYNRVLSASEVMQLYTSGFANTAPTDIVLSSSSVSENLPIGADVTTLTASDSEGGSFTYTLVSGTGDTDNAGFSIVGNRLKTNTAIDYESKTSYSIRIKATDNGGLNFEKQFTISVIDVVNESMPTNGLVAWYPFNGNANDESGNGNNGTVNGAILTEDRFGKTNSSYVWNNSFDNIRVASSPSLQLTNAFSISVWIKPINGTYGSGDSYHAIIEKWGQGGDASYLFALTLTGLPIFYTHDGGTSAVFGTTPINFDTWNHLTYAQNSNTGRLYINGILQASKADMRIPMIMNNDILFGSNALTGTVDFNVFDGLIDDISFYNRTLSDSEVMQLYTASKQVQVITFNSLNPKTYGDAPFSLAGYSNSGLGITYISSNPNVATISGNTVTVISAGTTLITATQTGNGVYAPAQSVQQTLTVNKAILTATAENKSRGYGDVNPSFTIIYSGFKNSESSSVIDTAPTATTSATITSNVGSYNIVPAGGTDNNYSFTFVNGTLTIVKATLTATAENKSRGYGDANSAFTIAYTGFKNSETATVIDTPPTASTTATQTSNVGTYSIVPSGGTDNNYAFTFVNGTLTIAKATLTATAENKSRGYGDANPAFTIAYTGFKNSETATVIDTPPTASTTATQTSNVGTYGIVPSGGTDNNYVFTFVNGTLTIAKATLTVTAENKSRGYGDANPAFTIAYTGFKNSETATVIDTAPTATTSATLTSNVGTYSIVPSGGTDNNYAFTFVNGTLTIAKATLTATATNKSRVYGDLNPAFTISYMGFKNSETATVIDTPPTASTTATSASLPGPYAIVLSGGMDNNYDFSFVNGTLTVTQASQTISFAIIGDVLETIATFNLTATSSSGLPITFTTTSGSKISINGNVVTILSAGSVTISATQVGNSAYTAATAVSQTFCIIPKKPIITATGLGTGNTILTSSAVLGNQWYRNGSLLIGATNKTYTVDGEGVYNVKAIVDGCVGALSEPHAIITTSMENHATKISLRLFPVPVKKELHISLDGVDEHEISTLIVYDLTGRAVGQESMTGSEGLLIVEHFASGQYMLRVSNNTFTKTTRFTKD